MAQSCCARIEPEIKRRAEGVLHQLGLSPTEAIRMFYRQITLRGGIPFAVVIPHEISATTLEKSRQGTDVETLRRRALLARQRAQRLDAVTVSPKYQVVIPRSVRERVHLHPGERLQVISFDDRIELIPLRPMRSMRGFLKGLDARFLRDAETP